MNTSKDVGYKRGGLSPKSPGKSHFFKMKDKAAGGPASPNPQTKKVFDEFEKESHRIMFFGPGNGSEGGGGGGEGSGPASLTGGMGTGGGGGTEDPSMA